MMGMHMLVDDGRIEAWRGSIAGKEEVTLRIGDVMLHMSLATARQVVEHLTEVTKSATAESVA